MSTLSAACTEDTRDIFGRGTAESAGNYIPRNERLQGRSIHVRRRDATMISLSVRKHCLHSVLAVSLIAPVRAAVPPAGARPFRRMFTPAYVPAHLTSARA